MDGVMYIDRHEITEFPFVGRVYDSQIDYSKPLDEQKEEEVLVLEMPCDIQESGKQLTSTITATYSVYFPFDKEIPLPIKRGMTFKSEMYGLVVNGEVKGVFPSQLGGCVIYVVDKDI